MDSMKKYLLNSWQRPGGYAEILKLAFPLILSTGSITIQHFVDRIFLAWYSPEAIAAAMPAGIISYNFMSLFIGTATYVNTFVAQYTGADRPKRIGPVVWQGVYFSIFAGLLILPLYAAAPMIFKLAGHAPEVAILEEQYFKIMIFSGFPVTASSAMAAFFSGRGKTWVVMWVTFASTLVNIILDYCLIFGRLGFPEMGIEGAALATVISQFVRLAIYFVLILKPVYRIRFDTLHGYKPDRDLLARLVRFGLPNGIHYFLEVMGWTFLILLIGRYGTMPLAASNITFNINHLAFMPMIGLGMALTILVGQRLGHDQPELAEKSTWSTVRLMMLYMGIIAAGYLFIPRVFLWPYSLKSDPEQFAPILDMAVHFLKFAAIYSIFDGMNIIFAAAVKGAGDTRFVMIVSVVLSWILMVIPSYLLSVVYNRSVYYIWSSATLYLFILGFVFLLRFLGGKWKTMRVIEQKEVI
ncbi:MATE family efflux transporter [bacterium I07]|nr:MATE family efflux transporter [bacterium I07]